MKLHPLLCDPQAVFICHAPIGEPVRWEDFRRTARDAMAAMQIELEGEQVVIKPNVTVGETYADPGLRHRGRTRASSTAWPTTFWRMAAGCRRFSS